MAERNILNVSNDNNNNADGYPLFLGDDLGFGDTINVTYTDLEDAYEELRSLRWTEHEFELETSRKDVLNSNPKEIEALVLNNSSQWLMDSLAARSILELFSPFITNNELFTYLSEVVQSENTHYRAYSMITRSCFDDPNQVLEDAKRDEMVLYRSQAIAKVFRKTIKMGAEYTAGIINKEEHGGMIKRQLLKTVATVYALETVAFMSSFACTFALCRGNKFSGIGKNVLKIAEEELLHSKGGRIILDVLIGSEGYGKYLKEDINYIKDIFDEVVQQEFSFADYLYSEGRESAVPKMNASKHKAYTLYVAAPMYKRFGLSIDGFGDVPEENPIPWIDEWLKPELVQNANQESEGVNYRIAQIVRDGSDEVLEYDY